MIEQTTNSKNLPALTSDHWHVIHARWTGNVAGPASFERSIVSEHEDRAAADFAARQMKSAIASMMGDRPLEGRDQVLVRKPDYKSLKVARRVKPRRK